MYLFSIFSLRAVGVLCDVMGASQLAVKFWVCVLATGVFYS